jgi:hypothetical protein
VAASAASTTEVTPPAPREAPQVSEADARALLSAWLGAQNTVDFVSYGKRYAERFTGIKRAGTRTRRFDREGWLEDRKPMFKPGLRVQAMDVQVATAGTTAVVRFNQIFATDTFKDEGPKELVLVATADGPRIAREEMLESKVAAAAGPKDRPRLWHVGSERVYLDQPVPLPALTGEVRLLPRDSGVYIAERALDATRLDEPLRAWLGKKLFASSPKGDLCETTLVELRARAEVIPHFGNVQSWEGNPSGPASERTPPASPAEIAENVWGLGQMVGLQLVATLSRDCPDALWATIQAPRAPALQAGSTNAELSDLLRTELLKLPRARAIQKVFSESAPERSRESWLTDAEQSYYTFAALNGVQIAVVSTTLGQGCGGLEESLHVVFELDVRGPTPRVIRHRLLDGVWGRPLKLQAALDLDDDGRLEFISGPDNLDQAHSFWRPTAQGYERTELSHVSFLDCPC